MQRTFLYLALNKTVFYLYFYLIIFVYGLYEKMAPLHLTTGLLQKAKTVPVRLVLFSMPPASVSRVLVLNILFSGEL